MGYCDPKQVRKGEPWYKQVNQPGFMKNVLFEKTTSLKIKDLQCLLEAKNSATKPT